MANETTTTTPAVGNFNYWNNTMYNQAGFNMPMSIGMNGSLFGGMGQTGIGDYSNDLVAPDFMKQNYFNYQNYTQQPEQNQSQTQAQLPQNSVFTAQPQQTYAQPQVSVPQQSFTSNDIAEQTAYNPAYQYPEQITQENTEVKTNSIKKTTTIIGALAPIATGLYKVAKGAKWSDIFKFKELGLKIPALAIAGWCVGSLIDGLMNTNTPQAAKA